MHFSPLRAIHFTAPPVPSAAGMFSCCFLGRLRIHWCHRRTYEKLDPTAKKGQIIMGKRKRKDSPQRTTYGCAVSPEFKRHIEETYDSPIDLSDAPDEMRLSDRIFPAAGNSSTSYNFANACCSKMIAGM